MARHGSVSFFSRNSLSRVELHTAGGASLAEQQHPLVEQLPALLTELKDALAGGKKARAKLDAFASSSGTAGSGGGGPMLMLAGGCPCPEAIECIEKLAVSATWQCHGRPTRRPPLAAAAAALQPPLCSFPCSAATASPQPADARSIPFPSQVALGPALGPFLAELAPYLFAGGLSHTLLSARSARRR